MSSISLLTLASMLGVVCANVCQPHSRLPPLLVTEAKPTPTVYVWPEEDVELHCRPSQPGGCRWMKGSSQLGTDCVLSTTERGTITCLRGEEKCGSIVLNDPHNQRIENYWEIYVYLEYRGQKNWSQKSSVFLCSDSGTILREDKLCDGTRHCNNGEDEWNCRPDCGPPFVGEHCELSSTPLATYGDGNQVTYVCNPGFSLDEVPSGLKRTCRAGRWTGSPPVCLRNVALNRTVTVTGQPMGNCSTAVDGALDTWCMLAPSVAQQTLAVGLEDNITVTKVLVRALNNRYTVSLRDADEIGGELSCPCQESNDDQIQPGFSGMRVCSCHEQQTAGKPELLVRGESGTFMSLSVAEIVALEAPEADVDVDECTLLDHPAHGKFEPAGPGLVKLSCDPGHSPSCSETVQCSVLKSGNVRLSCLPASCQLPPAIPNTRIIRENGTSWQALTDYGCTIGYTLYPPDQNTTASCGADGLWSIGHVFCLPETNIRVVAMRLSQQHARSMAALRAELLAGQQRLLAEQNSTQHRLSKLERDMALLSLADGAYLRATQAAAADKKQLEDDAVGVASEDLWQGAPNVTQQFKAEIELTGHEDLATVAELQQELEAAAEPDAGAAELVQLSELVAAADVEEGF